MYQVSWTTSGNTRSESGVLVTLKETTEFTGTKLPSGIANEAIAFSCTESDTAFTADNINNNNALLSCTHHFYSLDNVCVRTIFIDLTMYVYAPFLLT